MMTVLSIVESLDLSFLLKQLRFVSRWAFNRDIDLDALLSHATIPEAVFSSYRLGMKQSLLT